jgi:hypothetical protein
MTAISKAFTHESQLGVETGSAKRIGRHGMQGWGRLEPGLSHGTSSHLPSSAQHFLAFLGCQVNPCGSMMQT